MVLNKIEFILSVFIQKEGITSERFKNTWEHDFKGSKGIKLAGALLRKFNQRTQKIMHPTMTFGFQSKLGSVLEARHHICMHDI